MLRFAPEGHPFILGAFALTVLTALLMPWLAPAPLMLALFMLYFFRDPERRIPEGGDLFVSPADGKVIQIRDVREALYLNADMKEISIFMSPFDVHVNRAPCDGKVGKVTHHAGRFMAAYRDEASVENEKIEMVLETAHGGILVRQVAGFVARRAVCRKREGDALRRGERYGIIKFSSRLDIYLPKAVSIAVKLGDSVRAGETVLGRMQR